jgi:alpha-methylacyl-CoA racemase
LICLPDADRTPCEVKRTLSHSTPLDGIAILDLSRLLPGGLCTLLLADMGADVIKVEEPLLGDHFRLQPPFREGVSTIHLLLNRDKRSLALDLKQADGRRVLRQLAAEADVLIESFRPGVMKRLSLCYDELRPANSRLVYCSLSGFGQDSCLRDRPGHDLDYTAMSGLLSISMGEGRRPLPFGAPLADYIAAWAAALTIVASLLARRETGQGQYLDLSLADCAFACAHLAVAQYLGGVSPQAERTPFWGGAPYYRAYKTADGGYVTVSNYEPKFWRNLCHALGRPDLVDKQYATGEERERVIGDLEKAIRTRTRDEWVALFEEYDCCGMAVNDVGQALAEPYYRERGLVFGDEHVGAGEVMQMSSPLGGLEKALGRRAPSLGQHSLEVLHSLGYSPEEIADLAAKGVVRPGSQ